MIQTFNSLSFLASMLQTSPAKIRQASDTLGMEPAALIDGRPYYSREDTARIQRYLGDVDGGTGR